MYVVGVTGGIGSGKSTVCRVLAERFQIPFIYVDKISREIVQPGMPLNVEIREVFGDEAMLSDGNINRAYFRAMIIADPEQKALVDKIFYPHMKNEIDRKLANLKENGFLVVGIENAMMIEFGATSYVNKVVVVACSEESQLRRVMERDNQTEESARGMMKLQMPLEEKRKHADLVITNDGTLAELRDQINSLYESLPRIK